MSRISFEYNGHLMTIRSIFIRTEMKWEYVRPLYRISVDYRKMTLSFNYWDSASNNHRRTLDEKSMIEALGCYASDAMAYKNCISFEDFCHSQGYYPSDEGEYSKECVEIYSECRDAFAKLVKMGIDCTELYSRCNTDE